MTQYGVNANFFSFIFVKVSPVIYDRVALLPIAS